MRARWLVPILVLNGLYSLYRIWGQFRASHPILTFLQNPPFSNLQARLSLLKLNVITPVDVFGNTEKDFRVPMGVE